MCVSVYVNRVQMCKVCVCVHVWVIEQLLCPHVLLWQAKSCTAQERLPCLFWLMLPAIMQHMCVTVIVSAAATLTHEQDVRGVLAGIIMIFIFGLGKKTVRDAALKSTA